ncbi:LysR family transcriptional regulator [Dactylosporangium sp. CS-033363]|uniref:LysR family transcriptional regulator n=1 Tax=Dactylosporangium sp. CS-033363 TaxID=3239935 RepID=UPI003D920256
MDLELRQLRAFVAVVEAGTFTDAAAVLGLSQAAVSRAVAGLESALGAKLLHRTTRQVRLTAAGTQVLIRARAVLDEVAHLRRVVERSRTELRVGYAWAAMGRHTRRIQRAWAGRHPGVPLVFVQHNSLAAGLSDGTADVAVLRRALDDARFATAEVGLEHRCAAVATEHTLARRRTVRLADLTRYTMAIDDRTGTTSLGLWPEGAGPASVRATHGTDEWLTLIAANQAVGVTSEATAHQNPRPGVAYRRMADAPPIEVRLAWWRDDPPAQLDDLIALTRAAYGWETRV